MARFGKKPIVIEAFQWTGGHDQTEDPEWIIDALRDERVVVYGEGKPYLQLLINTLEGMMSARPGDYVIQGIKGEIYPCKSEIFLATYEPVA